jgi:hypothetical protein
MHGICVIENSAASLRLFSILEMETSQQGSTDQKQQAGHKCIFLHDVFL